MTVGIIKYGAGNIFSIQNAVQKLGYKVIVTNSVKKLEKCEKLVFPGQGEASSCMRNLEQNNLVDYIKNTKKPFLGICLGMQILYDYSQENQTKCLGIIPGNILKFKAQLDFPIPQIGWNKVVFDDLVFNLSKNLTGWVYYANSYYAPVLDFTLATSTYTNQFSAVIKKDNFFGTQFHPEKSGEFGLQILKSFLNNN